MGSPTVTALDRTNPPDRWVMTPSDRALVMAKHHANRLGFAVLLAFFRGYGRFPHNAAEVDRVIVDEIARQLVIEAPGDFSLNLPGRTAERHRSESRGLLGFR